MPIKTAGELRIPPEVIKIHALMFSINLYFIFVELRETVGLTEDVIRRYLMRKPMTTKDLLYKLKSKKIGLKSDVLVKQFTEIIRKLNPQQTKIKGKTYWFIKQ